MKIRLDMIGAYNLGFKEHPQIIMRNLGIEYLKSEGVPIGDCWIFYDCSNVANELPEFLYLIK